MKRSVRLAAFLMTLAMVISVFAGCGDNKGGGSAASPSSKEEKKSSESVSSETTPEDAGALDTSKEVELVMYVVSDRPAKQDEIDENFNG